MKKRLSALRTVFSLMLTAVELLIGVHFLMNILLKGKNPFEGGFSIIEINIDDVGSPVAQAVSGSSRAAPITFLIIVLGFALISLILFEVVPRIVEKKEEKLNEIAIGE